VPSGRLERQHDVVGALPDVDQLGREPEGVVRRAGDLFDDRVDELELLVLEHERIGRVGREVRAVELGDALTGDAVEIAEGRRDQAARQALLVQAELGEDLEGGRLG